MYANTSNLDNDEFMNAFTDWIESKDWQFGSGSYQVDDTGKRVNAAGDSKVSGGDENE